ncbi:MAG: TetR/AcrR family transcriptional regulator [Plectolyngbya sp. WJT66-NPBG17]|jgi:AcrR family transcriptional regulator|nr:TetR/AcrR family transcriptional regulator [Plectolyngbya sp. WJT66-NPBG17]MBW4525125.1 TetR/AcrR family transcriptional regulator [Phormidium tanganyikae FI6-MK23]
MPKIVDHDRYRKELLVKSFDLFAEKGYAAITMRQVAQGLGVSTGTLYHYFPGKEALFEQLVEELADADIANFSELSEGKSIAELAEAEFKLIEQNREYFLKQMLIMADYYQQQRREGKEISPVLRRICDRVEAAVSKMLGIDDPNFLLFLMSYTDGLLLQELYGHRKIDYQAQAKILIGMLENYFKQNTKNHD